MSNKKAIIVIFVLLFTVSILASCTNGKSEKSFFGNTNSNISNGGMSVMDQEWIYFMNYSDNGFLYKVKTDGSQEQKITDLSAVYLNISDNVLYFINTSDNQKLYRMNTDGTQIKQLTDFAVMNAMLSMDWIYFIKVGDSTNNTEYNRIYKIKPDGTNLNQVSKNVASSFNIEDNWIYYVSSEDGSLNKIETNGKSEQQISNENMVFFTVLENEVFYLSRVEDKPALWKMKLDGSSKAKLTEEIVTSFCVSHDWIYYGSRSEQDGGGSLKRMHLDGSSNSVFNSDSAMIINVHDNWLVYLTMNLPDFKISQTIMKEDGSGRRDYDYKQPELNIEKYLMGDEVIIGDMKYIVTAAYSTNIIENTDPNFNSQIFDDVTDGAYLFVTLTVSNRSNQIIDLQHRIGLFEDLGNNGYSTNWFQLADITNLTNNMLPTFHVDRQTYVESISIPANTTRVFQTFLELSNQSYPIKFGFFVNEAATPVAMVELNPGIEYYVTSWAQSLAIMKARFKDANIVQLNGVGFKFKGETEDFMYYLFKVTESDATKSNYYLVKRDTGVIYNGAYNSNYPDVEAVPNSIYK